LAEEGGFNEAEEADAVQFLVERKLSNDKLM
jgi:hypothetical protein